MTRFLLILAIEILVCTLVTVWFVTHPSPWTVAVALVLGVAGIGVLAASAFHLLWRPMLAGFPPHEPAPDAVRRRFQSFGLGIVNMGCSVHVAADDEYLHLVPLALWQRLGARPASIPWSAMEPVGKSGRVVRVGGHRLDGPKWCMELAGPARTGDPGQGPREG